MTYAEFFLWAIPGVLLMFAIVMVYRNKPLEFSTNQYVASSSLCLLVFALLFGTHQFNAQKESYSDLFIEKKAADERFFESEKKISVLESTNRTLEKENLALKNDKQKLQEKLADLETRYSTRENEINFFKGRLLSELDDLAESQKEFNDILGSNLRN